MPALADVELDVLSALRSEMEVIRKRLIINRLILVFPTMYIQSNIMPTRLRHLSGSLKAVHIASLRSINHPTFDLKAALKAALTVQVIVVLVSNIPRRNCFKSLVLSLSYRAI